MFLFLFLFLFFSFFLFVNIYIPGGFSDYYEAPTFMHAAIETYLTTVSPVPNGTFNRSMRAYPDVAMIGKNYQTTIGGFTRGVSGTSASAPVR